MWHSCFGHLHTVSLLLVWLLGSWAIKNPAYIAVSRVGKSIDPMISPAYQEPFGIIGSLMFTQSAREAVAEHPACDVGFTTYPEILREGRREPYRC
jgi:hypothetical protein